MCKVYLWIDGDAENYNCFMDFHENPDIVDSEYKPKGSSSNEEESDEEWDYEQNNFWNLILIIYLC